MVKTIQLNKNDYKYYEKFGYWEALDKNSKYPYITKRCGNEEDYWGGLSKCGNIEFKLKWIK